MNPGDIDMHFIKSLKALIAKYTRGGNRFFLVIGGGRPARKYQEALKRSGKTSAEDLDWLGIYATRLNAQLMRLAFAQMADPQLVTDPHVHMTFKKPVVFAGGWKPGRSTDFVATALARTYGAKVVINLSNIDYAYTKDPRTFKNAVRIERATWKQFRKIVGSKWKPGANLPFDPTAAAYAEKNSLTVVIANGKNLKNLENILKGREFKGTIIT